jgi:hypothetical protein
MTDSRPARTTTNARQRTEPDDQCPSAVSKSSTVGRSDSALGCLAVGFGLCVLVTRGDTASCGAGIGLMLGSRGWPSFRVSASIREVPHDHHDPIRCPRPRPARVH